MRRREDGGEGKIEYWICVVENVLTEDLKDYNTDEKTIGIWPINLSRAKPKHTFNPTHWKKRISPDDDW